MIALTIIFYFLWLIFLIGSINSDFNSGGYLAGCALLFLMFFLMFALTIKSVGDKKATQHNNYTDCMKANSIGVASQHDADQEIKDIKKLCNAIYSN